MKKALLPACSEIKVESLLTRYSLQIIRALITSVQLKVENNNEWTMEMMNALQAKRKTVFIDGSLKRPPEGHTDLETWLSLNSMIVGWLRTLIKTRVRSTVKFITNAHKLWENLRERFSVGTK